MSWETVAHSAIAILSYEAANWLARQASRHWKIYKLGRDLK